MSVTLSLPTAAVTDGAPDDTAVKRVPIAGGEPITTDGVTLAVCAKPGDEPMLCRLAVSTGAYRPTGRVMDFARALAGGLLAVPNAPVKPAAAAKAGGE